MLEKITICALFFQLLITVPFPSYAQDNVDHLLNLSMQKLLNRKVTSVSKNEENAHEAAAAVYIITSENIRRSGATSIAEALRLAPGLQVSRIDSNKWAITSRGSAEQFSNKLLVLMDGRSVYTPLFSGVYWDIQDTILEDIDRIEIIRGPGATQWGANAVNGVINIITKSSAETQGTLITGLYGNEEHGTFSIRDGGKIGDNISFRNFIKYRSIDSAHDTVTGVGSRDSWHIFRVGNRIDWEMSDKNSLMFQLNAYHGENDSPIYKPQQNSFIPLSFNGEEEMYGGNGLLRYTHYHENDSISELQFYVDHISRDNLVLEQNRLTVDFELQNSFVWRDSHHITWGVGYRNIKEDLKDDPVINYTPDDRMDYKYSFFFQDKFALIPDRFFIMLGSKFEKNNYTDYEIQPTARFSWIMPNNSVFWGAISRAVRTPSRGEHDLALAGLGTPAGFVSRYGDESFDGETLIAYELGYRFQPFDTVSVDATSFFNDYQLRTFSPTPSSLRSEDISSFLIGKSGSGETYGFELSTVWAATSQWNIHANYSFLTIDYHVDDGVTDPFLERDENRSPKNQFSLQSRYNLGRNIEIDHSLYYTDNISNLGLGLTSFGIPAHIRFDMRVAWRPIEGLEFSLVGQNLFDSATPEFEESLYSSQTEIERSIYGKVTWQF